MHPRYFIGIRLPDPLSNEIADIQNELLPGRIVMEPLVPHITLLHPNILMTISPIYLLPKVKEVAAELLPIKIRLNEIGMFDKRVLHIAVNSPPLVTLQKKLVEILPDDVKAQYEVGRSFTPHVTLAQAKPMQSLDDNMISQFKLKMDRLLPEEFEARQLTRFVWTGPRTYKVELL